MGDKKSNAKEVSLHLFHFLSTHGEKSLYDCRFEPGDALVFGNESSGLPKDF